MTRSAIDSGIKAFIFFSGILSPSRLTTQTASTVTLLITQSQHTPASPVSQSHNLTISPTPFFCLTRSYRQDASRRQHRMCSTAKSPSLSVPLPGSLTAVQQGQDVYIYLNDSHGQQRLYRVETREIRWYCYYCSHGPMSPELEDHCSDCHRRRSPHSLVETRRVRHRV